MRIQSVRTVLLSAPYAGAGCLELSLHLNQGYRSCSMLEITLEDGTTGLGEGYIGVFAPHVFVEIKKLLEPYLIGTSIDDIAQVVKICEAVCGYWSFSGAARHVISAVEIACLDAKSKVLKLPLYQLWGSQSAGPIQLYGSGGDSLSPQYMAEELRALQGLGITIFKIRSRNYQLKKVQWCLEETQDLGMQLAIDMVQNLEIPGQSLAEYCKFEQNFLRKDGSSPFYFVEEPLGPVMQGQLPELRSRAASPIAGGEIVSTPLELTRLIDRNSYDFVQPDATVIGGIGAVREIFAACSLRNTQGDRRGKTQVVVHSWGGAVCMMANYHAAFSCGASLLEYPLPDYPLRKDLLINPLQISDGLLAAPADYGLGVELLPEVEERYPFRPDAVYNCKLNAKALGELSRNEEYWG